MNSCLSRMRFRKKEIQDHRARLHIRRANRLLALSAFDGPAIPCRPTDSNHNTSAVIRVIPAQYRYPRMVKRTGLGRIASETSFTRSEATAVAETAVAP